MTVTAREAGWLRKILSAWLTLALCARALSAASCRHDAGNAENAAFSRDISGSLYYDGIERTYLLHLPPAYDGEKPLPLLLAFHGGGGDGAGMERLTHLSDIADERGFIIAYPDGLNKGWNDDRPEINPGVDDVGFYLGAHRRPGEGLPHRHGQGLLHRHLQRGVLLLPAGLRPLGQDRRRGPGGGADGGGAVPRGRCLSAAVMLVVEGGGHTWPGELQYLREAVIGKTCRDIDAGEAIWDFLQGYRL